MTAGQQIAGVATNGRPRTTRKPVEYTPRPARCPACLVDTDTSPHPANCPTREDATR
ncbi:hypothetical protein AB0L22_09285 [Micromonospora haikouensis]|uniref:hypothetical protein n=1 Tax=Micromonospora haikouensis TaxID=686309 RepID=UPI0034451872